MNNSLNQNLDNPKTIVEFECNGELIKLSPSIIDTYILGNDCHITLPEYRYFLSLCKTRQLNPFLKEVYCIKYGNNPAQIVVGKDAILKRAILHPQYDGMESGVIVLNNQSGEEIVRNGTFYLSSCETVVGGWAKVFRKDWTHPTYVSVSFDEVAQRRKDGTLNSMWDNKRATMVEKVAKVRALRETFTEQLGGMYDAAEKGVILPDEMSDYPQNEMPNVPEATPPIDVMPEPPQEISINDL